jgi:hypothetical protein
MAYAVVIFVSKRLSVIAAALLCLMVGRLAAEISHPTAEAHAVTSVRMKLSQTVR